MNQKFKILFLSFFISILFSSNSYSLISPCDVFEEKVKNSNLEGLKLEYSKVTQPQIKVAKKILTTENWKWKRDKDKNLIIGKIFDSYLITDEGLEIGDKIIKINGKKTSDLTDEELDVLLTDYNDFCCLVTDESPGYVKPLSFIIEKSKSKKQFAITVERIDLYENYSAVVDVKLNNILEVSEKNNIFKVDLAIETTWYIKYLFPLLGETLQSSDGKQFWCGFSIEEWEDLGLGTVAIEMLNGIDEDSTLIEDRYEIQSYKEDKVLAVKHTRSGSFSFANKYHLDAYPFDRQQLSIKIGNRWETVEHLNLYFDFYSVEALEYFVKNNDMVEWTIENAEIKFYHDSHDLTPGVEIVLNIERDYQYYLSKVIFPIILILMICWSVFWIHPREIESRLTITIVCLLSLIAYNFVIDEDLPKLGYLTIIDYVILLSYVFATLPNFLTIWSFQLVISGDQVKWVKIDKLSRTLGPVLFLFLVLAIIMSQVIGNQNAAALFGALRNI